jgi:hypothetical protein
VARIDNRGNLRGSASRARGVSVSGKGAQQLLRVSKALKAAGEGDLRKQFHKAIRDAAKPAIPAVRESARAKGPKAGGLNKRLAKKPYRTQVRTGNTTAGVRIVGTKVDPRINELGRIQHPVFGKGKQVVQYDPELKGYFDEPLEKLGPGVQKDVVSAMTEFTRAVLRSGV